MFRGLSYSLIGIYFLYPYLHMSHIESECSPLLVGTVVMIWLLLETAGMTRYIYYLVYIFGCVSLETVL
jgi:hypothetical protein